jgi:glycine betaine/choline ABC-type transport system substrate-binding protein
VGLPPSRRDLLRLAAIGGAAALGSGAGCRRRVDVTIGSKNFQEQWILAALLRELITRESGRSARTKDLAGTALCHRALIAGDLDTYVEYTGTAFASVLGREPMRDTDAVLEAVREAYRERFDVLVLPPLGFENTFALLVRRADADERGLRKLSDLASAEGRLRIGMGFEFYDRADGYQGLVAGYGLERAEARQMKLGLVYRALGAGEIDVAVGNSTDGHIQALDLLMLEDDRAYFPPYDAVPLLRADTAARLPEVARAIESLAGRITADQMRRANQMVDGERKPPEVAAAFLLEQLDGG